MEIRNMETYDEEEVLSLYKSVDWTAYTDQKELLRLGFQHSLLTLGAYEHDRLQGLIRAVGDGYTIVFIQDLLVRPEYQRRGIGTKLMQAMLGRFPHVRQIQLTTDNRPETVGFYTSLGLQEFSRIGCLGFMR